MTTQQEQVNKIGKILNKTDNNFLDFDKNLDYPFDDKCTAIYNWASYNKHFDTSTVEDIHTNVKTYGKATHNQMRLINNIITKFRIDVEKWCY